MGWRVHSGGMVCSGKVLALGEGSGRNKRTAGPVGSAARQIWGCQGFDSGEEQPRGRVVTTKNERFS